MEFICHISIIIGCQLIMTSVVTGNNAKMIHGKCFDAEPYMLLVASLDGCMDACIKASQCVALAFERRSTLCKIYHNTGTVKSCPGYVLVMSNDIEHDATDVCGVGGCPLTDCGPIPTVPGEAVVQGNQVSLNSVVKYTCTYNGEVTYVKCQSNGQWSTLPNCTNLDCGIPTYYLLNGGFPDLDKGTTLVGDTATYTCVYGYRLEPPSAGVRVVCNQSVQWETPNVTCVEAKNSKQCATDSECVDNNAICIRADNNDPTGKCFCNHNTTYNNTFQACSDECMLSEQFTDVTSVPETRIMSYDIGTWGYEVTNAEECWNYCLSLNGAHSADFNVNNLCFCKTVTYQQILDSDFHKKELHAEVTVITKTCL